PRTTSRPHSLASFSRRLPSFVISSPPPPSSTLFPYTTLFRSRGIGPNSQSKQRAEKTSALLRLTPPLLADLLLLEGGLDGGHHRVHVGVLGVVLEFAGQGGVGGEVATFIQRPDLPGVAGAQQVRGVLAVVLGHVVHIPLQHGPGVGV